MLETSSTIDASNNCLSSSVHPNGGEMEYKDIDRLLETENRKNKLDAWNKIDKRLKIQKLYEYAEKYGKDHHFSEKEIKSLKQFFNDCLEKNKLQKTKEVMYDKETKIITNIPCLSFNPTTNHYTLKIVDTKRVSTLKSLPPKRVINDL